MGLSEDRLLEIRSEYIHVLDFIDLLAMNENTNILEIVAFLLRNRFIELSQMYSIDEALRIKKVEKEVKDKFLEDILEPVVQDEQFEETYLPQTVIYGKEVLGIDYCFKKEELLGLSFLVPLRLNLFDDNLPKKIFTIRDNRLTAMRAYEEEKYQGVCDCLISLYEKINLDLDQAACILSGHCVIDINLIKHLDDKNSLSSTKKFWSCRNFIDQEVQKGNLKYDEGELFKTVDVAKFLYHSGHVIEGFNHWLAIEPIEAITNEQQDQNQRIADLERQLEEAQASQTLIASDEPVLTDRNEKSYSTTIGLLLELLQTPKGINNKGEPNKPLYTSQKSIINAIEDIDIYGQKSSTLDVRFSQANSVLEDAKKKRKVR